MNRHRVCSASLAIVLTTAGLSCSAPGSAPGTSGTSTSSTRSARDQLIGSWELQTRTVRRASGEVVNDAVLGEAPIGRLFYDASGHMALQMMRHGRAQAIGEPATPAEAANARVRLGYDAYFGTFNVDVAAEGAVAADGAEVRGTVTHHVQGSLFPEDLGKEFTRHFRVTGDTFELSFTSRAADGSDITRTLVFRRSR